MTDQSLRPTPLPTALSRPFWDACNAGQLLFQRCAGCGSALFIPRSFCPHCLGTDLRWAESTGRGSIVTFTVVWRPQTPAFEAPYVVAVVRLREGHEMLTNIVGLPPDEVTIGAAVRVSFVAVSDSVTLPCFVLDSLAATAS